VQVKRRWAGPGALALCVLGVVGLGASSAQARLQPKNQCVVRIAQPSGSADKITASGICYGANGQIVPAGKLHHVYTEFDAYDNQCGAFAANGAAFTPQIAGSYSVSVRYTLAPREKGSKIKPGSSKASFVLSNGQLQCGHKIGALPSSQLCDYGNTAAGFGNGDICGTMEYESGYQPLADMPVLGSKPVIKGINGNVVYDPAILTNTGYCSQNLVLPAFVTFLWMGSTVQPMQWDCPGGWTVVPFVYVYYEQPPHNAICYGPNIKTGDSYVAGADNLPQSGSFSQFSLPNTGANSWRNWGGILGIVVKAWFYPPGANPQKGGLPVATEFADMTDWLKTGGTNACNQLSDIGH